MRHYYATNKGTLDGEQYLDLWIFTSKKDRDDFVEQPEDYEAVTLKEVRKNRHLREQLTYRQIGY